ncbi:ATP-binding cassette domain-containing protein [Labilibaculum euxinus]
METDKLLNEPLCGLIEEKPIFSDFFTSFNIDTRNEQKSLLELMDTLPFDYWEENGISRHEMMEMFVDYVKGMSSADEIVKIESLEILTGVDKNGKSELCNLFLQPGEITCIVGPTGSGKSRLLADIEWLANADTPTKRKVLINGKLSDEDTVNQFGGKLIAQITQNMNFVLDMDVHSFLMLHAQSRFLENARQKVDEVIELANELSGECFDPQTPVTFLSGGQSRALMIADVACIGQAPIVLIDEIENAGVDKKKALQLLVNKDKIVLMATHDPLLILLADRRVIIKNGGMNKIVTTNEKEKAFYLKLEQLDNTMQAARNFLRLGNELTTTNELI